MLTPTVATATRRSKGHKEIYCGDILDLPMSVTPHEANVHDSVCADGVIDNVSGLTLFSVRTSLRRNSLYYYLDGLWSALSLGWKTSEELLWIMSSIQMQASR